MGNTRFRQATLLGGPTDELVGPGVYNLFSRQ